MFFFLGVDRWQGTQTHPTSGTIISAQETMKAMTLHCHDMNKPSSIRLLLGCEYWDPYHKTTRPQLSSLYATHLEILLYLCQIGIKPQAHKTKESETFCMCVILGPYHKPTAHRTAVLPVLHIESSISTSVKLGSNHKPTKPKDLKLFCLCLIFGPYHKPTSQLYCLYYTLRVIFLPLSDYDQTTSPQNQRV
jgi:hypothetical protein